MKHRRRGPAFGQAFSEAVRLVAEDYADFIGRIARLRLEEDARGFGARHAAARACLSHLEQLLNMIGEDSGVEQVRDGFTLLHEARRALGPPPAHAPRALPAPDHGVEDEEAEDGDGPAPR